MADAVIGGGATESAGPLANVVTQFDRGEHGELRTHRAQRHRRPVQSERRWIDFVLHGTGAMAFDEESMADHAATFEMLPGETLAGLLDQYERVARRTDRVVAELPDLDVSHPLPEAPWFEPGGRWSARRVLLHIIAETAQHAGHADIIREALDGSRSMG